MNKSEIKYISLPVLDGLLILVIDSIYIILLLKKNFEIIDITNAGLAPVEITRSGLVFSR